MDVLNSLPHEGFIQHVGWVFEHSPWVAERVSAFRPFVNVDALYRAMVCEVERATHDEKLALLRAHPDLGSRVRMSDASTAEQSGAGLTELTRDEYEAFLRLNTEYRAKFGFPFLFAVKGSSKHSILEALKSRSLRTWETEFQEALQQVFRIARFRLEQSIEITFRKGE